MSVWTRIREIPWDEYRRCLNCRYQLVKLSNIDERRKHKLHRFVGVSDVSLWEWFRIKLRRY